jgi:uncharacterized transporter YbjL
MERIKFILCSLLGTITFVPALVSAQNVQLSSLGQALNDVQSLMGRAVPILIGLAVIVFLYGVLKFILHANDADARKEGRSYMLWAIIGIVVMVSVWGLVVFVQNTFGLESQGQNPVPTPQLPR